MVPCSAAASRAPCRLCAAPDGDPGAVVAALLAASAAAASCICGCIASPSVSEVAGSCCCQLETFAPFSSAAISNAPCRLRTGALSAAEPGALPTARVSARAPVAAASGCGFSPPVSEAVGSSCGRCRPARWRPSHAVGLRGHRLFRCSISGGGHGGGFRGRAIALLLPAQRPLRRRAHWRLAFLLLHPCARARLIRTALGCQPAVEVDVVAAQHVAFAEETEEAPALERGTIPRREISSGRRRPRRRHFAAKEVQSGRRRPRNN